MRAKMRSALRTIIGLGLCNVPKTMWCSCRALAKRGLVKICYENISSMLVAPTDAGRAALDHFGPNVEWCAKKKKQIKDVQLELTGPGCRWSFELIAFRKGTSV